MNRIIAAVRNVFVNDISSFARILAALACLFLSPPASPQIVKLSVSEQFHTHDQHFSCTLEYAQEECIRDLQRLQRLLERYDADGLGEWQWVLVARFEWKPFCVKLGVDSVSPAMTSFVDHETFLDEALFDFEPIRVSELVRKFGAPWKKLLPLAVTHELGHAVCRDATEVRAEFYADELRRHYPGRCDSSGDPAWIVRTIPGQ